MVQNASEANYLITYISTAYWVISWQIHDDEYPTNALALRLLRALGQPPHRFLDPEITLEHLNSLGPNRPLALLDYLESAIRFEVSSRDKIMIGRLLPYLDH